MQASKQASKQAGKQATKQASKQARTRKAFSRSHALEGLVSVVHPLLKPHYHLHVNKMSFKKINIPILF